MMVRVRVVVGMDGDDDGMVRMREDDDGAW